MGFAWSSDRRGSLTNSDRLRLQPRQQHELDDMLRRTHDEHDGIVHGARMSAARIDASRCTEGPIGDFRRDNVGPIRRSLDSDMSTDLLRGES